MKLPFLKTALFITMCFLLYTCKKKKEDPLPEPLIAATPSGLMPVSKSATTVSLKWNSSTNAVGYRLYNGTNKIYEGPQPEYTHTALTPDTDYNYSVSAYNTAGESPKSPVVSVKTDPPPAIIPAIPTSLALLSKTAFTIAVTWDSTATAAGYRLYRNDIKIYEGNKRTFTDSALTANSTYKYSLTAFNAAGESAKSTVLTVITDAAPSALPATPVGLEMYLKSTTTVSLQWRRMLYISGFRLYRGNLKIYEGFNIVFTDSKLTANTVYTYTLTAFNEFGESPRSAPVTVKTDELNPPSAPTGLELLSKTTGSVLMQWKASPTALSYRLYRNNVMIAQTTKLGHQDSGLAPDTKYDYTVSAVNDDGESPKSSVLTVKTDPSTLTNTVHLTLGNPTNANDDVTFSDNYLLIKPQYALSYNAYKRTANWVSWELSKTWLGTADRQNDFRPDNTLPAGWNRILPTDYTNTGFDRGHLCPSADRTKTIEDNSSTFLMTDIIPQAPELNRESWTYLEDYCREIVKKGHKAYIIAGVTGKGGTGANGPLNVFPNQLNVPAYVYKIIVYYPENAALSAAATVIAVKFPNTNIDNNDTAWLKYITTPAEIEKSTGAQFFNALPVITQNALKNKKFDISTTDVDIDAPVRTYNGHVLYIGPRGGCYYINDNNNKTYVDRSNCGTE